MQKNINHQQGKHLKINMEGWNKKMNVKINKSTTLIYDEM